MLLWHKFLGLPLLLIRLRAQLLYLLARSNFRVIQIPATLFCNQLVNLMGQIFKNSFASLSWYSNKCFRRSRWVVNPG